jgi:hypothetical protein
MKCRYCNHHAVSNDEMKSHLRTDHRAEYNKVMRFLKESDSIFFAKLLSITGLCTGSILPNVLSDMIGKRF